MDVVRTNYTSLSNNLDNKRDKIFVLEIILAIEIRFNFLTFTCRKYKRVVDNVGTNVKKKTYGTTFLKGEYTKPTTPARKCSSGNPTEVSGRRKGREDDVYFLISSISK